MISVFQLCFGKSASSYYATAVRLAAAHEHYEEVWHGRRVEHICRFGSSAADLTLLLELWELVRTWRSTRLIVQGLAVLPRKRWRMGQILECAAQAARFTPPQRYCCSAPVKESPIWPGRPHFPCRHLLLSGFGYVLDDRVEWHDPERRRTQLDAILLERGVADCPFLNLHPFIRALEEWRPRAPQSQDSPRRFLRYEDPDRPDEEDEDL